MDLFRICVRRGSERVEWNGMIFVLCRVLSSNIPSRQKSLELDQFADTKIKYQHHYQPSPPLSPLNPNPVLCISCSLKYLSISGTYSEPSGQYV